MEIPNYLKVVLIYYHICGNILKQKKFRFKEKWQKFKAKHKKAYVHSDTVSSDRVTFILFTF